MLDPARQDARQAFRQLRRNPMFAAVAILTLAVGLGANSAIFSVLNTIYFRPLPFADGERLVRIYQFTLAPDGSHRRTSTTGLSYDAVGERLASQVDVIAQRGETLTLDGPEGAERLSAIAVTPRRPAGVPGHDRRVA